MLSKTPRREKTTLSSSSDDTKKKDTVQVFCRLRPLKSDKESSCIKLLSSSVLVLSTPLELKSTTKKEIHLKFKHIFTAFANQNEVFQHVAFPLLEDLVKGKNGLLFTYGVTGSGKTHTLTGDQANPGIMPKCIHTIFNTIGDFQAPKFIIKSDRMNGFEVQSQSDAMRDKLNEIRSNPRTPRRRLATKDKDPIYINDGTRIVDINQNNLYSVFVSYIEIYNNSVYDLLDDLSGRGLQPQGKILREDSQKNMYVHGVMEVEVKTAEEAFEMFNVGQKRKRMGNTILNAKSSRSHSIFNIRLVQFEQTAQNSNGNPAIPEMNYIRVAQLSLVDLAGSERTNRTQNTGAMLREASKINNSLMSLRTCLEIMRENQINGTNKLVPYRDSRLTLLFKNYFEGEGRVEMIVCVNPSVEDFEENLQVMKFAEIAQEVKVTRAEPKYTPITKRIIRKKNQTPNIKVTPALLAAIPDIFQIRFNFDNPPECSISNERLNSVLKLRQDKLDALEIDLPVLGSSFRKRLLEMDQAHLLRRNEMKDARVLLKKEKLKSSNFENKLTEKELEINNLMAQNEELMNTIKFLRNAIDEKDMKINRTILEKEKSKQKIALANERMTQELDAKLRRQRDLMKATMKAKDSKIQKAKAVLESKENFADADLGVKELEGDDVEYEVNFVPQTPTSGARRNKFVASTPRRRRSKSAGEVWLEHNSIKPVALGTVFQPSMKKRKSVTKLSKATDITNPKQSKYCLIAQDQDMDGEVETKLYKADIVSTCGGGAQVIFNDVERLKQESPTKGTDNRLIN